MTPTTRNLPLRIAVTGRTLNPTYEALAEEHQSRGHFAVYYESIDQFPKRDVPFDIIVTAPLEKESNDRIIGTCFYSTRYPASTLLVAMYPVIGESHFMSSMHVLGNRCHPKMLLCSTKMNGALADCSREIEETARGSTSVSLSTVAPLPPELLHMKEVNTDLGQIMKSQPRFGRLLYTAATNRWDRWSQLARLMGLAVKSVQNLNYQLGNALADAGFVQPGSWSQLELSRFADGYSSFIKSYYEYHLSSSPPQP